MAFRHGNHGTLTNKSVIWKCPSCGQENAGVLEAGCTNCKAGADAKKAEMHPDDARAAATSHPALWPLDDREQAFEGWVKEIPTGPNVKNLLREAFMAGARWATGNREPLPRPLLDKPEDPAPQGGWTVTLSAPGITVLEEDLMGVTVKAPVDPRTAQTILAALAFYRDNQLAYGAVPGQLDAQEVSALIEKLSPQEVEA